MKRSCLLLVSGAISIFGVAQTAFAATDSTDFSVTVNPYLNVTLSDSEVSLPIIPSSAGTFGERYFTATSSTNNVLGYSLNLSIKDTNTAQAVLTTNLTSDTINVNDGTKPIIPTFSTDDILTSAQFSASTSADHLNHWAMSLNDTDHYQKVINESTIASSDGPIADDVTTLNLATKLDLLTPPGSYAAYFNFEIVANVAPEPENPIDEAMNGDGKRKRDVVVYVDGNDEIIESGDDATGQTGTQKTISLHSMQDMTSEICASITTPVAADFSDVPATRLVDVRDNKVYWVAKLKDGHCWMTQNLDFALSTSKALSSDTTDIPSQWTPTDNTLTSVTGYNPQGSDSASRSVDGGTLFWNGNTNSNPSEVGLTNYTASTGSSHYHIGSYYSYAAAVAVDNTTSISSDSFDRSICPSGWTLPGVSGSSRDLYAMLVSYGMNSSTSLLADPFYPALLGFITTPAGVTGAGNSTVYWTNTANQNAPVASAVAISQDNTASIAQLPRFGAYQIRCVAR